MENKNGLLLAIKEAKKNLREGIDFRVADMLAAFRFNINQNIQAGWLAGIIEKIKRQHGGLSRRKISVPYLQTY